MNLEMSLSTEEFSPDCSLWEGYKPCAVQKDQGRSNCLGCESYRPQIRIAESETRPYVPEAIFGAYQLGVVEMGGLGSILQTTASAPICRLLPAIANE